MVKMEDEGEATASCAPLPVAMISTPRRTCMRAPVQIARSVGNVGHAAREQGLLMSRQMVARLGRVALLPGSNELLYG